MGSVKSACGKVFPAALRCSGLITGYPETDQLPIFALTSAAPVFYAL